MDQWRERIDLVNIRQAAYGLGFSVWNSRPAYAAEAVKDSVKDFIQGRLWRNDRLLTPVGQRLFNKTWEASPWPVKYTIATVDGTVNGHPPIVADVVMGEHRGKWLIGFAVVGLVGIVFWRWYNRAVNLRDYLERVDTGVLHEETEVEIFCPVSPAGSVETVKWMTDSEGRCIKTTAEGTVSTKPIAVTTTIVTQNHFWGQRRWELRPTRTSDYHVLWKSTSTWRTWIGWLRALCLNPREMLRWKTNELGDWVEPSNEWAVRMETDREGKLYVNFAEIGTFVGYRLSEEDVRTLSCYGYMAKKIQPYSVQTVHKNLHPSFNDNAESTRIAGAFSKYLTGTPQLAKLQASYEEQVRHILQFTGDCRDDPMAPWKFTARKIGPELCSMEDTAPAVGYQAGLCAVNYRVDKPRPDEPQLSRELEEYLEEYVHLVAEDMGTITPWLLEDVVEKQDGKLQKMRNALAQTWVHLSTFARARVPGCKVQAMVKLEPLVSEGPTRNISTLRSEWNLKMGRYCLAASKAAKVKCAWYMPGKTPPVIAETIARVCFEQRHIAAADISKMDSCKTNRVTLCLLYELAGKILDGPDKMEWQKLIEEEMLATAKTDDGYAYMIGGGQLSGSADTTFSNTFVNGSMDYAACRRAGMTREEAYQHPKAFAGDDSVSRAAHINPKTGNFYLEEVAKEMGYVVKLEVIERGNQVPFLSRFFVDPFSGYQASYQDPIRLLRKSHMTFSPPEITPQQAACNKWRGYYELDPASPLYFGMLRAAERVTGLKGVRIEAEMPYLIQGVDFSEGWPQVDDWETYFSKLTNTSVNEILSEVNGRLTWEEFLQPLRLIDSSAELKGIPRVVVSDAFDIGLEVDSTKPVPEYATISGKAPPEVATVIDTDRKEAEKELVLVTREEILLKRREKKEAARREKEKEKELKKKNIRTKQEAKRKQTDDSWRDLLKDGIVFERGARSPTTSEEDLTSLNSVQTIERPRLVTPQVQEREPKDLTA